MPIKDNSEFRSSLYGFAKSIIWVNVLNIINNPLIRINLFQLSSKYLFSYVKKLIIDEISIEIAEKKNIEGNKNIPISKKMEPIFFNLELLIIISS